MRSDPKRGPRKTHSWPLVLLHSLGTDHRMWQDQVRELSSQREVITPDSLGHGGRPEVVEVTVQDWVADLHSVVESLPGPVHLAGVSLGGIQALAYAASHPQNVASLVVADSFARLPPSTAAEKIANIAADIDAVGMAAYAERYLDQTLLTSEGGARRGVLADAIAGVTPATYKASARACFGVDILELLPGIVAPTLVLVGELDQKTPIALSEQIAELVPDSRLAQVSGAGHLANIDAPEHFTTMLTAFLAEAEAQAFASHPTITVTETR
ncbi:alpha/beta fold hydrolase [Aeromicrobium camelliae]|nr:alpha/beta fold hydrolase [Aeromicrobium camelliae]